MKSLLWKDWYTIRGQMKLLLAGMAVMALFPNPMTRTIAILYASLLSLNTLAFDEQARWNRYAAMLPYSAGQMVLSKYVFGLVGVLTMGALAIVGEYAISPMGATHGEGVCEILAMSASALTYQALVLPMVFRFGVERARVGFVLSVGVLIAGYICLMNRPIEIPIESAVRWIWPVAIAVNAVSMPLSVRLYRGRTA